MKKVDLIKELKHLEASLENLGTYSYDQSLNLQKIFKAFCGHRDDYEKFDMPEVQNFDQQISEIEENISGLTTDDKGRDLQVFKSRIFEKSKKDLIVFIRLYTAHLNN